MNAHQLKTAPVTRGVGTTGILVVEDDSLIAAYISEVLIELGFTVTGTASSGAEALSNVGRDTHLALVDISLAGHMDGIELARQLLYRHGIRSIFLSGAIDAGVMQRAAEANPHSFLQKPFLPSQVFRAITEALGQRELLKAS